MGVIDDISYEDTLKLMLGICKTIENDFQQACMEFECMEFDKTNRNKRSYHNSELDIIDTTCREVEEEVPQIATTKKID